MVIKAWLDGFLALFYGVKTMSALFTRKVFARECLNFPAGNLVNHHVKELFGLALHIKSVARVEKI